MKRSLFIIMLLVLLSVACSLTGLVGKSQDTATPEAAEADPPDAEEIAPPMPPEGEPASGESAPHGKCGDGICDGPENQGNCPDDCTQPEGEFPQPGAGAATGEEFWVTNPTTGAALYVHVMVPEGEGPFPAVVVVPGGTGDGARFRSPRGMGAVLTEAGIVSISFDPDGRGHSEGEEDFNGYAQQDGLAAVIEFAAELPEVDAERVGLASFSYGVTMASGALARHPDLPVVFFMDWEGPVDRFDTTVDCTNSTRIDFQPCDDLEFWGEREALKFISGVQVPYQRLQSEVDHVQPDVDHAVNIVNAAVQGGVPWVRLNDLPPNQTYDHDSPPAMIPETMDKGLDLLAAQYIQELFVLHAP